ncbi:MAG: DUF2807 domain-containing protein [Fluviicola sp.]|nr:DUF2807 domain-containing protein [Fluviicola sp.]
MKSVKLIPFIILLLIVQISTIGLAQSLTNDDEPKPKPVRKLKGSGQIITKTFQLEAFEAIELVGFCDLELVNGSSNSVELSEYESIIDHFQFTVKDNTLFIEMDRDNISIKNSEAKAKIVVAGPLKKLSISGVGDIIMTDAFNELEELNVSGVGDIIEKKEGQSKNITINLSGVGDINLGNTSYENVNCSISGVGDATFSASTSIIANITGVGDIYYFGNPQQLTQSVDGVGEVIQKNK